MVFKYNPEEQNKFNPGGNSFMSVTTDKMFTPQAGQYKVRILPPWSAKGLISKFMKTHWALGIAQLRTVCPEMHRAGSCPYCYAASVMRGNSYEKYKDDIQTARATDRYFSNVINLAEPHKGVLVWAYGKIVYKQIKSIQDSGDYGDITDDTNGTDLTLVRTGTGRQIQDTIYPVRQSTRLANPAWLEEMFDLDAVFKEPDVDAIAEAFKSQTWKVWDGGNPSKRVAQAEIPPEPARVNYEDQLKAPEVVTPSATVDTPSSEQSRLDRLKGLEDKLRKTANA